MNKWEENLALTFDDISLSPAYSDVLPNEVSLEHNLCKNLILNMPIISAAMDTVTEHKMAIVMAQRGGFGVIHKNMSIASQVSEVDKVKKYESGMILDPITISPAHLLRQAHEIMDKYSISGIPVTENEKLVGIITHRDLRFEGDLEKPVKDFMTSKENLVTASRDTDLESAKSILHRHRIEKLPVVDQDFKLIGLITIKDIQKSTAFPKATKDNHGRLFVGAAVGTDAESTQRVSALIKAGADLICIDTAHGHSKKSIESVKAVRKKHPEILIVAGNVATEEGTEALIKAGADIIKVGMGPGSICTTRVISGVGIPQISAIMACSKKAKKMGYSIIADGGIKFSGDIVKALALGAGAVMVGNILAGSEESPGETVLYRGRTYKVYRGMGSLGAMKKGSRDRYNQESIAEFSKLVPEGIEGRVPYRGSAQGILDQMTGGICAGLGYTGSKNIATLQDVARFVRLTPQSLRESHVHDVSITKEAPNYRIE